jgi:hypothetical protein
MGGYAMKRHVPTDADGRQALREHLVDKASDARAKLGGQIDTSALTALLDDRSVVRYPVTLAFGAERLMPGEFAFAEQIGEHPSLGFRLWLHPCFESQPERWPALVAYHLPTINYGDIVTAADCENFGAVLLGMSVDQYYSRICTLADSIPLPG